MKKIIFFGKHWVWRVRDGRKVMVGDHHLLSPFLLGRGELESRCASITHPWWIAGDVICYSPSFKRGWWKHTYYDHLLSSSQGRVTPGDTSPDITFPCKVKAGDENTVKKWSTFPHHLLSPFLLGKGESESRCASITHPWWIAGDEEGDHHLSSPCKGG